MTAVAVVQHLDVIDDVLPGSGPAQVSHPQNPLNVEVAEKTLGHSIVPAIGFSAHAARIPCFLSKFWESWQQYRLPLSE